MSDNETQDLSEIDVLCTQSDRADDSDTEYIATIEYEGIDGQDKLEIPLYPGQEIRIGRDRKCHYAIQDERVSKKHFRIYSVIYEKTNTHSTETSQLPALVYCEDLESSNGTYVNDVLIGIITQERIGHLLCDGDIVEIRPFWKFRFHQPNHQIICRQKTQSDDLEYFKDRYTVFDRILGAGRFGNVYLAKELDTMKQVACKIVDLDLAIGNHSGSQRTPSVTGQNRVSGLQFARVEKKKVLREIQILSKLSHPNVINIKKAFCSNYALYIFTDLAAAGDLFSYVQSHGGRLDDYNSRVVTRQVALAVQYIHSRGIAHRDIKPENVLVTHTDFGGRVILTDFGFATYANIRNGRMLSKLGTEGFAAPEIEDVAKTSKGYTMAVDLWSLGVLTVCLLTGDAMIPHQELSQLSQVEIAARFLGVDESCTRHQWMHMPPRALTFIRGLLVVDPEERMTATEALNHSWYTKPLREAEALADGLKRINRFWREREIFGEEILEGLPGNVPTPATAPDDRTTKLRKNTPDASLSPYFGLDRHLNQRMPSGRERILADLNESGSQFITIQPTQQRNLVPNTGAQGDRVRSRSISVDGRDLFGMSLATKASREAFQDIDEADIPTAPMRQIKRQVGLTLSDPSNLSKLPKEKSGARSAPSPKGSKQQAGEGRQGQEDSSRSLKRRSRDRVRQAF